MKTIVKSWYADKGYGFLVNGGEGSRDILVHVSELKNCTYLKPGRTVEFDVDCNNKGLVAKNVILVHENQIGMNFSSSASHQRNYQPKASAIYRPINVDLRSD